MRVSTSAILRGRRLGPSTVEPPLNDKESVLKTGALQDPWDGETRGSRKDWDFFLGDTGSSATTEVVRFPPLCILMILTLWLPRVNLSGCVSSPGTT